MERRLPQDDSRSSTQAGAGGLEKPPSFVNKVSAQLESRVDRKNIVITGATPQDGPDVTDGQQIQKHIAASVIGDHATLHISANTIYIGGLHTYKQGIEKVPDITGIEDKDIKKFLDVVNKHTWENIKYDICGKRENLKKPTKQTQPKLMIINMDGKNGAEINAESAIAERGKLGLIGTDVVETKLNDFHKKHGESEVRHVLLIGNAGEGKTTIAKRYAFLVKDRNEPSLEHIELVLYIPLSNVDTEKSTPFDLLITKQLGKLDKKLKIAGKKWLEENPNKTMIIFDGLDQSNFSLKHLSAKTDDETCTSPEVIIANILSNHIYSGMKILSTSRLHTFWTLGDDLKPDRIIALRGFSEIQVKHIFRQLLGSNADPVLHHLQQNAPDLLSLCSTPNILLNAASVLSQSPKIRPETQTAILAHIVKYLLRSEHLRNSDPNLVAKLSKLAYHSIKENIFAFKPSYLREFDLEISDVHDFMSTDAIQVPGLSKVLDRDQRCSFHHQTIQEFFAALHICCQTANFQPLLKNIREDAKMENVLLFLIGVLAHEKTFKTVQDDVLNVKVSKSHVQEILAETLLTMVEEVLTPCNIAFRVFRLLQECDKNFFKKSTADITGIMINDSFDPGDNSFLASSMVSKLTNLEVVQLYKLVLNPSTIRLLSAKINSMKLFKVFNLLLDSSLSGQPKSDIEKIINKVEFSTIFLFCGDDVARFALGCIKGRKDLSIATSRNKNLDHATYRLITAAGPSVLNVDDNDLQDEGVKQLLAGLEESGAKVNELSLSENKNLTEQGFSLTAEFIAKGQTKRIFLRDCNLNGKKMKALHEGLEGHDLEIEVISIDCNKTLEPKAFQYIPGIIAVGHVQRFDMRYCALTTEKLEILEEHAADKNIQVEKFAIGGNTSIQPGGYRLVLNISQHFSVKFLIVDNCGLTAENIEEMANHTVGKNLTLHGICIDGNKNIGSDGFKLLVDFMQHVRLQILQAVGCDLDPEKLKAMADQAEEKQLELHGIFIDGNKNIGSDGFKFLVDFMQHAHLQILRIKGCDLDPKQLKAMADQAEGKQLELKTIIADENQNIGPDGCKHLVDFLKQTMIEKLNMEDCRITSNMLKNLIHQLKSSHVKFEHLDLSQNSPDAVKEYLPYICQLFHCVSRRIILEKWRFNEDDRRLLKAGLQKCPFQDLKFQITDDFGNRIAFAKKKTDTFIMQVAKRLLGLFGMLGLMLRFEYVLERF